VEIIYKFQILLRLAVGFTILTWMRAKG